MTANGRRAEIEVNNLPKPMGDVTQRERCTPLAVEGDARELGQGQRGIPPDAKQPSRTAGNSLLGAARRPLHRATFS